MSADTSVHEVLEKCNVFKAAGLWLPEPAMRPRAWIKNFEEDDQKIAAFLLDKFTFYNKSLTQKLLIASYDSLGDGMPKGGDSEVASVIKSLDSAILTPVNGERPNPADSGNLLCRMARQSLKLDDAIHILNTEKAIEHASKGGTVLFIDDFVGSGDQFLSTWKTPNKQGVSFQILAAKKTFTAIYVTLIATDFGMKKIYGDAPEVLVCTAHVLEKKSTIEGVMEDSPEMKIFIHSFLDKYSQRLTPRENYIANNPSYLMYGYKKRGLLFGFEHSMPDATLPIFWSPGKNNWEPLIERS
ncbi:hypothetical protein [Variovorax sp. Varisp62]|uniref:phosphoribosyltransferase-like protein n=1 Tax=Variovorax sp. Varisp62 TaxID=3243049 RepID=UPI0039B3C2FF